MNIYRNFPSCFVRIPPSPSIVATTLHLHLHLRPSSTKRAWLSTLPSLPECVRARIRGRRRSSLPSFLHSLPHIIARSSPWSLSQLTLSPAFITHTCARMSERTEREREDNFLPLSLSHNGNFHRTFIAHSPRILLFFSLASPEFFPSSSPSLLLNSFPLLFFSPSLPPAIALFSLSCLALFVLPLALALVHACVCMCKGGEDGKNILSSFLFSLPLSISLF